MPQLRNSAPLNTNGLAYLVVMAGICAALHVWKLPPALPELQKELGLTLVESGFLLSLFQMGGMALGLLVGLVAEKVGLRRCVLIGLGLLSVASASGAVFDSKTSMLVLRAIEGCGFLMVTMAAPSLIQRLVQPAHLSRVLGVWGSYMPIGTVIILLVGSWLLSMWNWRVLWWLLAFVTLLMLALVWRRVPADPFKKARIHVPAGQDTSNNQVPSAWFIVKTTLSSENVWLVALAFGMYSSQWIAVIGFLPTTYTLAGISGTTAGIMTAIVAGANALGNFGAGRLLHKGVRPQTLLITGFSTMLTSVFVAFALNLPAGYQFVAIFCFSAFGGLIPTTLFVLAIQLAPNRYTTATAIGWMQQLSALGQFSGPPMVAWVATLTGGWQQTWWVTGSTAAIGVVLSIFIGVRNQLKGHIG